VFEQIHCSCRIHCSFSRFISTIKGFLSVGDFTVHIFNQIDFSRFLLIFTKFSQFIQKLRRGRFFNVRGFFKQCPPPKNNMVGGKMKNNNILQRNRRQMGQVSRRSACMRPNSMCPRTKLANWIRAVIVFDA
jgi:hypothetical protein